MRRILFAFLACTALTLTACDWFDNKDNKPSEASQAVSTVRDWVPPGPIREVLSLVALGLGAYGARKGVKVAATAAATEQREYNRDEGRSMAAAILEDPIARETLRKALLAEQPKP